MNRGGEQSVRHARASLDAALDALRADADCEVFVRRTHRLSVELEQGETRVRQGLEEGTAVRLRAPDGALRFGAASGAGVDAAASARCGARALPATPSSDAAAAWAREGNLLDIEDPAAMPEVYPR